MRLPRWGKTKNPCLEQLPLAQELKLRAGASKVQVKQVFFAKKDTSYAGLGRFPFLCLDIGGHAEVIALDVV